MTLAEKCVVVCVYAGIALLLLACSGCKASAFLPVSGFQQNAMAFDGLKR